MRRSQRLSNRIECIIITDSEDDDAPLPRQQNLNESSYDSETSRHQPIEEIIIISSDSEDNNKLSEPPVSRKRISPPVSQEKKNLQESAKQRATKRQLVLDRIIGAVSENSGVDFVVKWKGLEQLERVPLGDMRTLFPRQTLEYMFDRIRWREKVNSDTTTTTSQSEPQE